MLRILYIADHRDEDFETDRRNAVEWAMTERSKSVEIDDIMNPKKYEFKEIVIDETEIHQDVIQAESDRADVIVVDCGGMSNFIGAPGLIDHWNRFFLKLIEDRPSKEWYIASNVDMYEPEDHERLEQIGIHFRW